MLFPVEGSEASLMGEPHSVGESLVLELEECLLKATRGSMAGNG